MKKKKVKKHKENKKMEKAVKKAEEKKTEEKKKRRISTRLKEIMLSGLIALAIGLVILIITKEIISFLIFTFIIFIAIYIYIVIRRKLKLRTRIRKLETVFPDFIELMSSNLRAGMTIDKAILTSSRKEFAPLDSEILILGKDLLTGKEISLALIDLAKRTRSEKIKKTVSVIISGLRSGGDLAILLDETAVNMRERAYIEKRAASNVLMYLIFIFFAVSIGAPALFSLSATLVQVLTSILSGLPEIESNIRTPITLTSINISLAFVNYFSLIFIIIMDILAALLLGLVNKGEEREGIKYVIPLIAISLVVYFFIRAALGKYFANLLG